MSSVKVSGNASGTGEFTIAAPNTNSNYTLTLPTATTTLVGTDATQSFTNKSFDSAPVPTVSGTAPLYAARAWVNFNGTGTVAIRASGNVSSITDNGTGDYTVNFTTAMSDANYAFSISAGRYGATFPVPTGGRTTQPTTTSMRIYTTSADGTTGLDPEQVSFTVFR
jgi:hypothetical protein